MPLPPVVDASVVDDANEQVGFEGLVLESGGDEEGAVFEVVKMPVPKIEAKDDSDAGGRGGGLSPAVHAGGDLLPAQQPQARSSSSSSSSHVAPPGLALDSGSGGPKPVDKSVCGVSYIDKDGSLKPLPASAPPGLFVSTLALATGWTGVDSGCLKATGRRGLTRPAGMCCALNTRRR